MKFLFLVLSAFLLLVGQPTLAQNNSPTANHDILCEGDIHKGLVEDIPPPFDQWTSIICKKNGQALVPKFRDDKTGKLTLWIDPKTNKETMVDALPPLPLHEFYVQGLGVQNIRFSKFSKIVLDDEEKNQALKRLMELSAKQNLPEAIEVFKLEATSFTEGIVFHLWFFVLNNMPQNIIYCANDCTRRFLIDVEEVLAENGKEKFETTEVEKNLEIPEPGSDPLCESEINQFSVEKIPTPFDQLVMITCTKVGQALIPAIKTSKDGTVLVWVLHNTHRVYQLDAYPALNHRPAFLEGAGAHQARFVHFQGFELPRYQPGEQVTSYAGKLISEFPLTEFDIKVLMATSVYAEKGKNLTYIVTFFIRNGEPEHILICTAPCNAPIQIDTISAEELNEHVPFLEQLSKN